MAYCAQVSYTSIIIPITPALTPESGSLVHEMQVLSGETAPEKTLGPEFLMKSSDRKHCIEQFLQTLMTSCAFAMTHKSSKHDPVISIPGLNCDLSRRLGNTWMTTLPFSHLSVLPHLSVLIGFLSP